MEQKTKQKIFQNRLEVVEQKGGGGDVFSQQEMMSPDCFGVVVKRGFDFLILDVGNSDSSGKPWASFLSLVYESTGWGDIHLLSDRRITRTTDYASMFGAPTRSHNKALLL